MLRRFDASQIAVGGVSQLRPMWGGQGGSNTHETIVTISPASAIQIATTLMTRRILSKQKVREALVKSPMFGDDQVSKRALRGEARLVRSRWKMELNERERSQVMLSD